MLFLYLKSRGDYYGRKSKNQYSRHRIYNLRQCQRERKVVYERQ
nr:MAG TPA: hypothetical protein [Caudoviricetes sp.]